jgi:hypothetical protein
MQVDRLLKLFLACGLRYAAAEKKRIEGRSIGWKQPELGLLVHVPERQWSSKSGLYVEM